MSLLSNEVIKTSELLVSFRSRISFALWIGPFVVLGVVLLAVKDGQVRLDGESDIGMYLVGVVFTYLVAGILGGVIERVSASHCRRIRLIIQELATKHVSEVDLSGYAPGDNDEWCSVRWIPRIARSKRVGAYAIAFTVMIAQALFVAAVVEAVLN